MLYPISGQWTFSNAHRTCSKAAYLGHSTSLNKYKMIVCALHSGTKWESNSKNTSRSSPSDIFKLNDILYVTHRFWTENILNWMIVKS